MIRTLFILIAWLVANSLIHAQGDPLQDTAYQNYLHRYEELIAKSHIDGHYIPTDVADAVLTLDKLIEEKSQAKIKVLSEKDLVQKLFFGFGRWLRINWSFDDGSRLAHHLKGLGITHPEDMVEAMMIFYQRHLMGKDLNQQELAGRLAKKREELRLSRLVPIDTAQQE